VADDILDDIEPKVEVPKTPANKGATDEQTVQREEEAIQLDGLSVDEFKKIRESAEKHQFQAEVFLSLEILVNNFRSIV